MTRVCLGACVLLSLALVACGPKVNQGNGYTTKSPWKKLKPLALAADPVTGQVGGHVKGSLSYPDSKRAKWYTVDLTEHGDLSLNLSFEPSDSGGAATVAMEVLDQNYNVISEDPDAPLKKPKHADADDGDDDDSADDDSGDDDDDSGDDDGESDTTQKARELPALDPGRYYVHLFVTKRMDSADFDLNASFISSTPEVKSDYPKDVAWIPDLPQVPVADDTPVKEEHHEEAPPPCKTKKGKKCKKPTHTQTTTTQTTTTTTSTTAMTADVVSVEDDPGGGANIRINAGTADGLAPGRKGSLKGVKNGGFSLGTCTQHACTAHVKATANEVKNSTQHVYIP
jgi:hypothetical protein